MRLVEYSVSELHWSHSGLCLNEDLTLLAAKNATGKTRVMNTLIAFADIISSRRAPFGTEVAMTAVFRDGMRVVLKIAGSKVLSERVEVGERLLLERGADGKGALHAQAGSTEQFHIPETRLAIVDRRNLSLYPELEQLHAWARSVFHYPFSLGLGHRNLAVFVENAPQPEGRDPNATVALFIKAKAEFGEEYERAIVDDMAAIGYAIEELAAVSTKHTVYFEFNGQLLTSQTPVALQFKEAGVTPKIEQIQISSGMWRALALFIHFNHLRFSNSDALICVDDIGEGLDFERSKKLIARLQAQATAGMQILLSTNDRFVMNGVPLNKWVIIKREGGRCSFVTPKTHPDQFEMFRFTGLSNVSFLEMNFDQVEPGDI